MTFSRLRLPCVAACVLMVPGVWAQESTGGTGTGGAGPGTGGTGTGGTGTETGNGTGTSGTNPGSPSSPTTGDGASSSFGSPSQPAAPSLFGPQTLPAPTPSSGPSSPSFRMGESTGADQGGSAPGAASSFGADQPGTPQNRTPPTTFSVPGLYGRGPQQFVVGEGRLARPRFRYHGSLSTGYDDNVFQTPTRPVSFRAQKVAILVQPAVETSTELVLVPSGDPLVPDTAQQVEIPGQKAKFRYERIPGIPGAERIGSFVTRASAGFDVQLASRRDLFTFDLDAGDNYYWSRPGKKSDYNGTLSLIYLRKLTGRAQFTMTIDAAYQSQPNFSLPNQPTTNTRGSYMTANAKADLSYRLTPRFSSVTSVSYNSLYSAEQQARSGDYAETTFGTELRYLFSPRLTLLGELRYGTSAHNEDSAQDTNTYFLLVGGELTLTRRFTSSLRLGESLQTYVESGQKSSSPYVEATLAYRLAKGTTIQWNARYGYEESGNANSQSTVARSGLALTHIFSPRLQASVALNLLHNSVETTSEVAETTATTTAADSTTAASPSTTAKPRTKKITTETIQDIVDATIGFHYTLSRRWAFNLNYTYTMVLGPEDTSDYYRQQIFFGTEFMF